VAVDASVTSSFAFAKVAAQPWRAVQRRAHETVWESVQVISNSATKVVQFQTNSFVELGGGLNAPNADGRYVASDLSFELVKEGGAVANRADEPGLHSSFQLSAGGESIGLYDPFRRTVDSVVFPAMGANVSRGRCPDGGTQNIQMTTPTAGAANTGCP